MGSWIGLCGIFVAVASMMLDVALFWKEVSPYIYICLAGLFFPSLLFYFIIPEVDDIGMVTEIAIMVEIKVSARQAPPLSSYGTDVRGMGRGRFSAR